MTASVGLGMLGSGFIADHYATGLGSSPAPGGRERRDRRIARRRVRAPPRVPNTYDTMAGLAPTLPSTWS